MILHRIKQILVIVCTIFFMVSCLGNDGSGTVSDAEMLMEDNDFAGARKVCDNLISGKNEDNLSAKDLCRLSIIYMKLSECTNNEEENIATAILCFRNANVIDADSVNDFLLQLPLDDARHVSMLCSLFSPVHDISNDELIDTLDYE